MSSSFPRTNRPAKDLECMKLEDVFLESDKQFLLEFTRELRDLFAKRIRELMYALLRGRYHIGRRKPRKAHRNVVRKMRRKWHKWN